MQEASSTLHHRPALTAAKGTADTGLLPLQVSRHRLRTRGGGRPGRPAQEQPGPLPVIAALKAAPSASRASSSSPTTSRARRRSR
eukprot:6093250-Heterocapsa_arctica.AAC.1